jgi:hypothetical protein
MPIASQKPVNSANALPIPPAKIPLPLRKTAWKIFLGQFSLPLAGEADFLKSGVIALYYSLISMAMKV